MYGFTRTSNTHRDTGSVRALLSVRSSGRGPVIVSTASGIERDRRDLIVRCLRTVNTLTACGMSLPKAIEEVRLGFVLTEKEVKHLISLLHDTHSVGDNVVPGNAVPGTGK